MLAYIWVTEAKQNWVEKKTRELQSAQSSWWFESELSALLSKHNRSAGAGKGVKVTERAHVILKVTAFILCVEELTKWVRGSGVFEKPWFISPYAGIVLLQSSIN